MTIPNRRILMRPVLGIILNEAKSRTECARQIANEFNLTAAQRAQLVPNGRLTRIQDTVDWAIVDIVKAGYAVRPRRGYVVATQQGRGFYAGEVSNNVRNREVGNNVPERTPSECIEEAYAGNEPCVMARRRAAHPRRTR